MSLEASASSMFKASTFVPVSKATFHTFSVTIESVKGASARMLGTGGQEKLKRNEGRGAFGRG